MTKSDKNGQSRLVPMELWQTQKHYIQNRTHRDICVKSRQTGFSTGVMADNAHRLFTLPYQRMCIITHDQETSEFLFQTVQRFHRNLPPEIRPVTDWKSGTRMRFPNLDSYVYIDSAKSDTLGIGHTLNVAHLSEVARYPAKKALNLFADISQTVPEGGYITLESTPQGRAGLFYDLYKDAKAGNNNYKAFFYPWWWDITCIREVKEKLEYTKEEKELAEKYKLTTEQITFRREKIAELKDLFFQEYPESDVDCWLAGEMSVFDGVAIRQYMLKIDVGKAEGNLTIWKDVIGGEKYVIGTDTAGGHPKGDFSVASVIRCKTNEYVARLRGRIPPDLFTEELIRLGKRYNFAKIAVPDDGHRKVVLHILQENNYPDIYLHEEYDTITGSVHFQVGWQTNSKTKPFMVDSLAVALRSNDLVSWSENLMNEASAYVWERSQAGKMKATKAGSSQDDELDAVMVALQIREQTLILSEVRYKPLSYISL